MSIAYRPEIDGMRALAVLSVVFYHFKIPYMTGGFVGVDVFFVISGFLITQKIHKDLVNRSFSFASFYLARLRRIVPALLVTIVCVVLLATLFMSPQAFQETILEAFSATFSVSNIFFWLGSGYFESDAYTRPLLHTWSLSVEEQYYLVWPLLLLLFSKLRRLPVFGWIATLFLISLFGSEFYLNINPDGVFFLTPFRVFEFTIGGFLATFPFKKIHSAWAFDLLTVTGLSLIVFCIVSYTSKTSFPGFSALLPCIGTGICIYVGNSRFSRLLLMNKLSLFTGKISYSLYLVHWPIIVFSEYVLLRALKPVEIFFALNISILLAYVLYKFVEQPFRKQTNGAYFVTKKALLVSIVVLIVFLTIISIGGWKHKGSLANFGNQSTVFYNFKDFKNFSKKIYGGASCRASGCETLPNSDNPIVYVIGDSHGRALHAGLKKHFPDINFIFFAPDACSIFSQKYGPLPGSSRHPFDAERCNKMRPEIFKRIIGKPAPIILAQHWATRYNTSLQNDLNPSDQIEFVTLKEYVDFVNLELEKLKAMIGQNKIVVFGGIPRFDAPLSPLDCLSRPLKSVDCSKSKIDSPTLKVHHNINEEFQRASNVSYAFINPFDYLCDEEFCLNFDPKGNTLYSDKTHLSRWGADYLIGKSRKFLEQNLDIH